MSSVMKFQVAGKWVWCAFEVNVAAKKNIIPAALRR
jgi:hypothetical protein